MTASVPCNPFPAHCNPEIAGTSQLNWLSQFKQGAYMCTEDTNQKLNGNELKLINVHNRNILHTVKMPNIITAVTVHE